MINKILPRKLNSSADSRVSDSSDMRDAVNVSSSDDFREGQDGATGNSGVLKPIKSNIELGNSLFADGDTLRVIGKAICNKHNVIYFFVCDETTASESGVYAYDPDIYFEAEGRTPDNIVKIFTSASFGFQPDSFVKADLTYVQKKFQERETTPYLFFTDNLSEPKKLNVLRAYYETEVNEYSEGSPEEIDFITACPVTPSMPPTASFTGTESSGSTNEFVNVNGFQFAYQLIYRDGNESAISTYSDIAIPIDYINQGTSTSVDTTAFDLCNVSIPGNHITAEVETVRIIARRGNDGAWQTIHEEDDPDVEGFTYGFLNNTVDTSVPTEDIQKQFTNLPKKAYTQTIIGDRVFYGNYVEGFDKFPVSAEITAVPNERPIDGLSYEIVVEPATCVSEWDEFRRYTRDRAEFPDNYDDVDNYEGLTPPEYVLDRIFDYNKSVNKNTAFRIRANELPEEIEVGRRVNLSFSFVPDSNFHLYQASNGTGYHSSAQLGDFFGPIYNPVTGEALANANEKTAHYLSQQQIGAHHNFIGLQQSYARVHPMNLTGGGTAPDYIGNADDVGPNFALDTRPFTSPCLTTTWQKAYEAKNGPGFMGTSAYTPLVIPMDGSDELNVSLSLDILDLRGFESTDGLPAEDAPSSVSKAELIKVIQNYLSRGSVDPTGEEIVQGTSEYTWDLIYSPVAGQAQFDADGWYQDVVIDRAMSNGQQFGLYGAFAKTITLVGLTSKADSIPNLGPGYQNNGEEEEGGALASAAVTINKATVRFRLFPDKSYKRTPRPAYGGTPEQGFYHSISGEGIENQDQRVGLYVEYIEDVEFFTCLRMPGIGCKWKVYQAPEWSAAQSLDPGTVPNYGYDTGFGPAVGDPVKVFANEFGNNPGPLSHMIGRARTSSGAAETYPVQASGNQPHDIDGLHPNLLNNGTFALYEMDSVLAGYAITYNLPTPPYEDLPEGSGQESTGDGRRRYSRLTLIDGGGFGSGARGSIEDSENKYDILPVTTEYNPFAFGGDGYSEVVGAYNLGTCPFLQPVAGSLNDATVNAGGFDADGALHSIFSPCVNNIPQRFSVGSLYQGAAEPQGTHGGAFSEDEDAVVKGGAYPYPFAITDPSGEGWRHWSPNGYSPTHNWLRRFFETTTLTEVSSSVEFEGVDGVRSFKSSAYHGFGVIYYDNRGRANSLQKLGEMYSPAYYSRSGNEGSVGCKILLGHTPPEWAEYFQIVYTGNTSYSDFIQYTSGGAFALGGNNKGNIFVSLNYLQDNPYVSYTGNFGARNVDGSDVMYTPQPGDILRVISYFDESETRQFPNANYTFEVVDYRKLNQSQDNPFYDQADGSTNDNLVHGAQTGDFVIIRDNPLATGFTFADVIEGNNNPTTSSHFWNNKTVIEIVRPTDAQAEENQVFYESSAVYPISEHANEIIFNKGDVWFRRVPLALPQFDSNVYENLIDQDGRGNPNFVDYYLETKAFNDKIRNADVWSRGKVKVQNPDEHEVRREASITFSDKNNPASKFLRLTSFSPSALQFKDMPLEHGAINYLVNQQDSILSIQKNKTASVPFNRNIISTAAGQDSLVASSSVLGTEVYYAGKYGCDDNPESVCEIDGVVYFASKSNAEVYRFTPGSGIQVISDAGMKSFFRTLFKRAEEQVEEFGPVKVVGGYDPLKKEFLLSVYNFNEVDEGSSIDFDPDPDNGGDVAPGTTVEVLPQAVTISATDILERISPETRSDLNNDGSVSVADLLIFLTEFGEQVPTLGDQTFTQDGDDIEFIYPE